MSSDTESSRPRQSFAPEPLKRFTSNPVNREKLKAILQEPAFIAAINLLENQDRVRAATLFTNSAAPDPVVIRQAAYHAGVAEIYERLQGLVSAPTSGETLAGWDHIQPTDQ